VRSSHQIYCKPPGYQYNNFEFRLGSLPSVRKEGEYPVDSDARPKRGILVFIRSELFENVSLCSSGRFFVNSTNLASTVFEFATFKYRSLGIIVIYKSPTYPLIKKFKDLFQRHTFLKSNCLVLGDFNMCLHSISGCCRRIFNFCKRF